jgi:UDP-N-acetyl-D-glucosamine dehydrogenase
MGIAEPSNPIDIALDNLRSMLRQKSAHVGVIGMGYVGRPFALLFAHRGLPTTRFDTDPAKVEMIQQEQSYMRRTRDATIAEQISGHHLQATTDFSRLDAMDAIFVCVPTPLGPHREPDFSQVRIAAEEREPHLHRGQLMVIESTTYPGTIDKLVLAILERSGLQSPVSPYTTDGLEVQTAVPIPDVEFCRLTEVFH